MTLSSFLSMMILLAVSDDIATVSDDTAVSQ